MAYLIDKNEPVYELALQRQLEIESRSAYYMRYLGFTEPSDVEMDMRTFTSLDLCHDSRPLGEGLSPEHPIHDTDLLDKFMNHGNRGAPFPRKDQEPCIAPA